MLIAQKLGHATGQLLACGVQNLARKLDMAARQRAYDRA